MTLDENQSPDLSHELESVDDRELTLAFKRGDDGAYEAIYERHSARVHNVCKRMLRRPEEAQEAAQETFLRMYRALPKFNGKYQLGAWITRIATNVCLDQLRSQGRHPVDLTPFDELELVAREAAEGVEPESIYLRSNEGWRVRRVLDSLPPLHKAAIVLRDFEGLSYEEVAQALGISDAQTKALIHRARQGFKRSWAASVASLFFPAKLLDRFRSIDFSTREHAVQVASPASQIAVNCNVALQQCGQFFTERAATLVTAGVFATAAVGGAAALDRPPHPQRVDDSAVVAAEVEPKRERRSSARAQGPKKKEALESNSREPGEKPDPTEETPVPTTTPTPEATPTAPASSPTPGPTEPPAGKPQPSASPTPTPVAGPMDFTWGFEGDLPTSQRVAPESSTVDCVAGTVDQSFAASLTTERATYTGNWTFSAQGGATVGFSLSEGGKTVSYNGGAGSVSRVKRGDTLFVDTIGSYSRVGDARHDELPEYGRFRVKIEIDCKTSSIISEMVSLSAS